MSTPESTGQPAFLFSDTGSFEQLFRQNYGQVCNIIHRYVSDKSKVEDIAQEMFAELWTKKDSLQIHTSISAYLRRMAISRTLNYMRDSRKYNWEELESGMDTEPAMAVQEATVIQSLEESELKKTLETAINKLPEKCRVIFMLSRYDELSYAEISRQLNISIKTVENQIGKALKQLRLALTESRG